MGTSTDGILAYGYDLGSPDQWLIDQADEDGNWQPAWLGGQRNNGYNVHDAGDARLRDAGLHVEFVHHCHSEYPMYVLAAHHVTANRGDVDRIDFAALDAQRIAEDWDGKLGRACEVLGITPADQPRPGWLLVSYWG